MNLNEALSELFYLVIVLMSILVAYEFYKSRDGLLRVLIISLFLTKVWVYGGAFIYYGLLDLGYIGKLDRIYVSLILNFPMVVVMVKLWTYIRTHNK